MPPSPFVTSHRLICAPQGSEGMVGAVGIEPTTSPV
jgi:hypothetical protein